MFFYIFLSTCFKLGSKYWKLVIYYWCRAVCKGVYILFQVTPAESRELNKDCIVLGFYDNHDIWHFLSACAMFFTFIVSNMHVYIYYTVLFHYLTAVYACYWWWSSLWAKKESSYFLKTFLFYVRENRQKLLCSQFKFNSSIIPALNSIWF